MMLRLHRSKVSDDGSNYLELRCSRHRRKKGGFWNPLNLIGPTRSSKGGSPARRHSSSTPAEKDELQKRVKYLEKRLLLISQTIDKCEQNKQEIDCEEDGDVTEAETGPDKTGKKESDAYMLLLRQMMKHNKERKFLVQRSRRQDVFDGKRKLIDYPSSNEKLFKPCYEHSVARVQQNNTDVSNKWCEIHNANGTVAERSTHEESINKKYLKSLIDEVVIDSIGKGLNKYFSVGLESYIKQRVESAVKELKNEKNYSISTLHASYTSHHPRKPDESKDVIHEFSSFKKPEGTFMETTNENSGSSTNSEAPRNNLLPSRTKFIPRAFKYKCHENQISCKRSKEAVSTTSFIRAVVETNKHLLKPPNIKPSLSDRNHKKKIFTRKVSRDGISYEETK